MVVPVGGIKVVVLFTVAFTVTSCVSSADLIKSSRLQVCCLGCIGHLDPGREGAVD